MNDFEFFKIIGDIYKKCEKCAIKRRNEDYVVNQPQMDKYLDTVSFFQELVSRTDGTGKIDPIKLEPKNVCGRLNAYFYAFILRKDDFKKFGEIMSNCSALTIDALNNGMVCISLNVPDVFVLKDKADMCD